MYDEKYVQRTEHFFNSKDAQGWLLGIQDYLAGRCTEIDGFLKWVSEQTEVIEASKLSQLLPTCMNQDADDVSKQLWALLAALLANNADQMLVFRNVERHNGAEAWRRVAEPINEGRDLRRKQFQPRVLRPKAATKVDDIPAALEQ